MCLYPHNVRDSAAGGACFQHIRGRISGVEVPFFSLRPSSTRVPFSGCCSHSHSKDMSRTGIVEQFSSDLIEGELRASLPTPVPILPARRISQKRRAQGRGGGSDSDSDSDSDDDEQDHKNHKAPTTGTGTSHQTHTDGGHSQNAVHDHGGSSIISPTGSHNDPMPTSSFPSQQPNPASTVTSITSLPPQTPLGASSSPSKPKAQVLGIAIVLSLLGLLAIIGVGAAVYKRYRRRKLREMERLREGDYEQVGSDTWTRERERRMFSYGD